VKRTWILAAAAAAALCLVSARLEAQQEGQGPSLEFGPRLGVSALLMAPDAFNSGVQSIFPSSDRYYFPVFSQMGVEAVQLISLRGGKSALTIHEVFLLGGLDQSMAIPTLDLIVGYRSWLGFEVGLGPHFAVNVPSGALKLAASVVYAFGWVFHFKGFSVPLTLTLIPLPSYANPQFTFVTGFTFAGDD
jgi:hypothetical protein